MKQEEEEEDLKLQGVLLCSCSFQVYYYDLSFEQVEKLDTRGIHPTLV